jgi:hypothetical protein
MLEGHRGIVRPLLRPGQARELGCRGNVRSSYLGKVESSS